MIWSLSHSYGDGCEAKDTDEMPELMECGLVGGRCPSCAAQDVIAYLEDHIETINL